MRPEIPESPPACPLHEALERKVDGVQSLFWKIIGIAIVAAAALLGMLQYTHSESAKDIAAVQANVDKTGEKLEKITDTTTRTDEAIQDARRRGKL